VYVCGVSQCLCVCLVLLYVGLVTLSLSRPPVFITISRLPPREQLIAPSS